MKIRYLILLSSIVIISNKAFLQSGSFREEKNHNIRRVVMGFGLNSSFIEKYWGLGIDLDVKFRFGRGRHLVGIGAETMFSINKKRVEEQEIEFFTGDTNDVTVGYRLYAFSPKIEYHYYLINPVENTFSIRIGGQLGPEIQVREMDYLSVNTLVNVDPYPIFEVGFLCGPLLGFEYFDRNFSGYAEFGGYYRYVNKFIPNVDGNHFFSGSLKLGVRFNFGPKYFGAS